MLEQDGMTPAVPWRPLSVRLHVSSAAAGRALSVNEALRTLPCSVLVLAYHGVIIHDFRRPHLCQQVSLARKCPVFTPNMRSRPERENCTAESSAWCEALAPCMARL